MGRATETVARQWELLSLIPREPRALTTSEIHSRLVGRGYDTDRRTVQRDLVALESRFALRCRTEGRANLWFWSRHQAPLEIPAMSTMTAITFLLVRDYLVPLMPHTVIDELEYYFERATEQVRGTKFARWANRVRMLHRGPALCVPTIQPAIRDAVYSALMDGRQLQIEYQSREATEVQAITANPLALVIKDGVVYLVATLWNYDDTRQLALHRMKSAVLLEHQAKSSSKFSLQKYVESGSFSYAHSMKEINLEVLFEQQAAYHLLERKIARDQKTRVMDDGRVILKAKVRDTDELRWWLLGFGSQVEVRAPAYLKREFRETALAMAKRYGDR